MVGGRRQHLTCFFASHTELLLHSLLLWFCLHDVEASECDRVVHKKVGDTVEFSSCYPPEDVTYALWKHGDATVAIMDQSEVEALQFRGRTSLNRTNFSLTLRSLTLQDSGDFLFVSETKTVQRKTVTITLQVHASLTPPLLTVNSTWTSTKSCMFLLECISTSDSNVAYNWTVKNETYIGSRLQYTIRPQGEDTTFTCTIFNFISEQSASETVKCDNKTAEPPKTKNLPLPWSWVAAVAAGAFLLILITTVISVCLCKRIIAAKTCSNECTVYLDISEIVGENKAAATGTSEYDVIRDDRPDRVTPMPNTVYDEIQLWRVRLPSDQDI